MYERFYGLAERPFDITPNTRYLVLTPSHEEALNNLELGITARRGITLLLGEAGTGKTTLIRKAIAVKLRQAGASPDGWVYMSNPTLTRREFFQLLCTSFNLSDLASESKTHLLREFEALLRERHERGLLNVLIVDEAQSLPYALLEELRLLANIESETTKLLSLVLAGQPELGERLNEPALRQLKQRVSLRCRLEPLTLRETASYIAARVQVAGGDAGRLFTREAVIAIHRASRGIPRTISVICDNALVAGFAADEQPVDAGTIREVCADFDLQAGVLRPEPQRAAVALRPAAVGPRPAVAADAVGWKRG
jgi:general secretion pathway protein A